MIRLCGFGVSNYYNKLKLLMLEKDIPFAERTIYPWERDEFIHHSPLGKIPYLETEHGGLSETQAILEYLEERYPDLPLLPADPFARAKCRELIQHLELNVEWVVRRLYKEAFFGGVVSDEIKQEVRESLIAGLTAVSRLSTFCPYAFASTFSAADCVAFLHLDFVRQATTTVYGEDLVALNLPAATTYMASIASRPHFKSVLADRAAALAAFQSLGVPYEG
jgi:glutathione S-transferase